VCVLTVRVGLQVPGKGFNASLYGEVMYEPGALVIRNSQGLVARAVVESPVRDRIAVNCDEDGFHLVIDGEAIAEATGLTGGKQ